MKALALRTRFRSEDGDGDACLLVYDSPHLASSNISADVRDVLNRRPNTPWIYVLCPFLSNDVAAETLFGEGGFAPKRAGSLISLIYLAVDKPELQIVHRNATEQSLDLASELIHGWLFDLFDSRGGLVSAPAGVHFTKLSGQHTDKFLRTSNVLLNSAAIGAVAFFSLALIGTVHINKVFVDTAPLVSVAFAIAKIGRALGISTTEPEVESFSSYGGIRNLPPIGSNDLFLLSASTSGSLAVELVKKNANPHLLLTLFYLGAPLKNSDYGHVVCDLTNTSSRVFGYDRVNNFKPDKCRFCQQGFLSAPLEGDQFLLEKRDVMRLRVSIASQPKQAREVVDLLSKQRVLSVDAFSNQHKANLRLDLASTIEKIEGVRIQMVRLLRRFSPNPLDAVVLIDFDIELFKRICIAAELDAQFNSVALYPGDQIASMPPKDGARVLVVVGVLDDHSKVRSVNAQMRVKAAHGEVTYLSLLTLVDSAQNLRELETFLCYGERGADTFTFKSAMSLMLSKSDGTPSSWTQELELLQRMASDLEGKLDPVLVTRLKDLLEPGSKLNNLFLNGKTAPLAIAADFVYLNTHADIELISQADVFVVVSNLLATARCDNAGLSTLPGKLPGGVIRSQSIYGQILVNPATLCPRNMRDYNDSILRAAFIRAAYLQELNFAVDERCSYEILAILVAEIDAWSSGHGNATPEFIMALACGRMNLWTEHLERFTSHARLVLKDELWAHQLLGVVVKRSQLV